VVLDGLGSAAEGGVGEECQEKIWAESEDEGERRVRVDAQMIEGDSRREQ
jgi:hypothetical protein